jgi:hypothetical protein
MGLTRMDQDFVLTWYNFEDNTPCNSVDSSSGRPLIPFVSVALPFRFLKTHGGQFEYGDRLYVRYLDGKVMPNGVKHTGWVQIDDYCGDNGDDNYCYQTVKGKRYPNVDLWIGSMAASTQRCSGGPAGSGQELTEVYRGTPPSGKMITSYGGQSKGPGKRGDCSDARQWEKRCYS